MPKQKFVQIPIYLYVSKNQVGFNQFSTHLLTVDEDMQRQNSAYKRFDSNSAREFYRMMTSTEISLLAQKVDEIELHCRGTNKRITITTVLDGYFGRPTIEKTREIFLRRLTNPERDYLQKQFDRCQKTTKGKPIRLNLVD